MTTINYSTTTTSSQPRQTYSQDWPLYNAAQHYEQEHFVKLLRDLCDTIRQPPQSFGRPRLPLADVVFGIGLKVYSLMSGRRAMSDFRDANAKGLLDKAPSFTSTFRYLENPELTTLLQSLIGQSAMPLRAVEVDFAVDSSGFSTSVYNRWFDHKWGKVRSEAQWIKAHIMVGVKTHVVTGVEVLPGQSSDSAQFPSLLNTTAENFDINEVSADKAYLSKKNLHLVDAIGGTAYIPFKINSVGHTQGHHKPQDSLWERMFYFYKLNSEVFMEHYHKRSNVESAFNMVKAKFGGSVRAKTPVAQTNEVLIQS